MRVDSEVTLTRIVSFSAGHRYWLSHLSEAENRSLYGALASPFSHGHNYKLAVSVKGVMDEKTGMVFNIKLLDDWLQENIIAPLNLKSLNDEIPYFRDHSPSIENILRYFRNLLRTLPLQAEITRLRLEEMPTLYGEWHDKLSESMATLTRIYEFCASHRLYSQNLTEEENQRNFGKCANLHGHGHNYLLEVTVEGEIDERTGMIADIFELDRVVNLEVVDRYDHKNFNEDLEEFKSLNPTSEVITQMIWNRLKNAAPARLVRIRLQETARSVFEISAS